MAIGADLAPDNARGEFLGVFRSPDLALRVYSSSLPVGHSPILERCLALV